jgi:3-mercaptopyruvate sulfurtransferase SseA
MSRGRRRISPERHHIPCGRSHISPILLGSNGGHLPNSLNVPYTEVFDQTNQCLKSKDELNKGKISMNILYSNILFFHSFS